MACHVNEFDQKKRFHVSTAVVIKLGTLEVHIGRNFVRKGMFKRPYCLLNAQFSTITNL